MTSPAAGWPWSNRAFLGAWWLAILAGFWLYPGYECRGLAFGCYLGVVPLDGLWRTCTGDYGSFGILVAGAALAGLPVAFCAWVWDRCALGWAWRCGVVAGSLALAVTAVVWQYGHFDQYCRALQHVTPDTYEITRSDHWRDILIPVALVGAAWWTTGFSAVVAVAAWAHRRRTR